MFSIFKAPPPKKKTKSRRFTKGASVQIQPCHRTIQQLNTDKFNILCSTEVEILLGSLSFTI